ncbi:MAG: SPASM domain-containing protein, partial [Candidatus Margulisiibacteriota bacterium]
AFKMAVAGFRNCVDAGVKVGLRLTLTKHNCENLPGIFDFIEAEKINRACFYHLVYSGRGGGMVKDDLTHDETRKAIDYIIERSGKLRNVDILTVDNHTDGVYIYKKLKEKDPARARKVLELLKINAGNSSGRGIACVDNLGNIYADQFWKQHTYGNVHKDKFSKLWQNATEPVLAALGDRKKLLKGKCAVCNYVDICNGNFRVRAEAVYNDPWQEDPSCYLTREEVTS